MISETLNNIEISNIVIMPPIKNNIIDNGVFYKLLYTNQYFIMNGLYIYIREIRDIYDIVETNNKLSHIEDYILSKIPNISNKEYSFKVNDFIQKIHYPSLIKMSGIWENSSTIGISYKIYPMNRICKYSIHQ